MPVEARHRDRGVQISAEGNIDLNGFLGLGPDLPKDCSVILVRFHVKAGPAGDTPRIRKLAESSPMFHTICWLWISDNGVACFAANLSGQ